MSAVTSEKWFSRADRTLGSAPEVLEVAVEVSGAHLKSASGPRELFTENTETTLVFEDGAVVRLAAETAVGQMLFLKHKHSQREIVTRVLRQRSFSAGSAYVELEFAEPAPGFWTGAAEPLGLAVEQGSQALPVASSKLHTTGKDGAAPQSVNTAVEAPKTSPDALLEAATEPPTSAKQVPTVPAAQPEQHSHSAAPLASEPLAAAEETPSEPPVRRKRQKNAPKLSAPPAYRESLGRVPLLAALLVLALLTAVAYQKGLLGDWFVGRGVTASLVSTPPTVAPRKLGAPAKSSVSGDRASSAPGSSASDGGSAEEARASEAAHADQSLARKTKSSSDADNDAARNAPQPSADNAVPAAETAGDGYEPPKLVKAVNATPPPDAVENFVTGDVKFDAVVDATGKVTAAKVLSGPAPLQPAALEALHKYQFKAATKNGQAVAAHVITSVKFWYEP